MFRYTGAVFPASLARWAVPADENVGGTGDTSGLGKVPASLGFKYLVTNASSALRRGEVGTYLEKYFEAAVQLHGFTGGTARRVAVRWAAVYPMPKTGSGRVSDRAH